MNFLGLQLAANCMKNNRTALEIVGQNISNSQVEGYTRQEAIQGLVASGYSLEPAQTGSVSVGSRITEIARYRQRYLDDNLRREITTGGQIGETSKYLTEISEIFTDDSDFGLPNVLNQFWQSWNSAAQSPEDMALRDMVIQNGDVLAHSLRMKAHKLDDLQTRIDSEISLTVNNINNLIDKLASINDQIIPSTASTFQTNILLDQRDLLLDQLSELIDVHVVGDVRDSVTLYLDGSPLVADKNSYNITYTQDVSGEFHFFSSAGRELEIRGGKLLGLMGVRTEYIPNYKSELDAIAAGLIENVNSLHNYGYGIDGSTGLDFFSGTDSSDIVMNLRKPEQLALSVPSLTSTANINVDGEQISSELTIASQSARFLTTPEASGSFTINGTTINWTEGQTLRSILDDIQQSTGIIAEFDTNSQSLIFSAPLDSSTITITDVTGNFTEFANLSTAVTQGGQAGDGRNGVRIFEIITKPVFGIPPTVTINDRYKNFVEKVGFDTDAINSINSIQEQYLQSLREIRASSSGVSVDEELIDLMKYQRTFQAGARMATVIDEMLQSLLAMK